MFGKYVKMSNNFSINILEIIEQEIFKHKTKNEKSISVKSLL